jgi:hypothetical protein
MISNERIKQLCGCQSCLEGRPSVRCIALPLEIAAEESAETMKEKAAKACRAGRNGESECHCASVIRSLSINKE